ncbi:hypothetical protein B0H13DRAFT_703044 [Mycena leptocephala]|nr:hypothetical protein B0H13DRAFT_703044 [Mycena leptocephala]
MLATLLPTVALFLVSRIEGVRAQNGSSIPGLTDLQQQCLANCLFIGVPAAPNCPQYTDDPDIACFCSSSAFVTNVTQCASAQCNICTTGGCNITANPLTDVCGSNATVTGSASSSASSTASGSVSGGAPAPSGSGAPNSSPHSFAALQSVTIFTAALVVLGLVL